MKNKPKVSIGTTFKPTDMQPSQNRIEESVRVIDDKERAAAAALLFALIKSESLCNALAFDQKKHRELNGRLLIALVSRVEAEIEKRSTRLEKPKP